MAFEIVGEIAAAIWPSSLLTFLQLFTSTTTVNCPLSVPFFPTHHPFFCFVLFYHYPLKDEAGLVLCPGSFVLPLYYFMDRRYVTDFGDVERADRFRGLRTAFAATGAGALPVVVLPETGSVTGTNVVALAIAWQSYAAVGSVDHCSSQTSIEPKLRFL